MWKVWKAVTVGVVGLAVTVLLIGFVNPGALGMASASTTTGTCPNFLHAGFTYYAMYSPSDGSISAIVGGIGPGFGPGGYNSTNPGIVVTSDQAQAMMCDLYQNSSTADYSLPWHVDLTTHQLVES